ncbi:MAG: hypothetical protein ACOCOK_02425, partial [Prevotella sp.]
GIKDKGYDEVQSLKLFNNKDCGISLQRQHLNKQFLIQQIMTIVRHTAASSICLQNETGTENKKTKL